MTKRSRKHYDFEYKKRIVQEFLTGRSANEIAEAEGLVSAQIYKWKSQLENRKRLERIEEIQAEEGVSLEQARKIRELEEELAAAKEKIADLTMVNDLLKKIQPSSRSEKRSSGYIETKRSLGLKRGPVK
jgi:transposase-like protein